MLNMCSHEPVDENGVTRHSRLWRKVPTTTHNRDVEFRLIRKTISSDDDDKRKKGKIY
jgi:hypothetical protein